ncbi:hypothetical protein GQ53DRAFT_377432 [Thozetella sp. PMI_491]|nr:hypothetical protein GQ53DRAFT_377432 [Thozetella sp. PMI_491]
MSQSFLGQGPHPRPFKPIVTGGIATNPRGRRLVGHSDWAPAEAAASCFYLGRLLKTNGPWRCGTLLIVSLRPRHATSAPDPAPPLRRYACDYSVLLLWFLLAAGFAGSARSVCPRSASQISKHRPSWPDRRAPSQRHEPATGPGCPPPPGRGGISPSNRARRIAPAREHAITTCKAPRQNREWRPSHQTTRAIQSTPWSCWPGANPFDSDKLLGGVRARRRQRT